MPRLPKLKIPKIGKIRLPKINQEKVREYTGYVDDAKEVVENLLQSDRDIAKKIVNEFQEDMLSMYKENLTATGDIIEATAQEKEIQRRAGELSIDTSRSDKKAMMEELNAARIKTEMAASRKGKALSQMKDINKRAAKLDPYIEKLPTEDKVWWENRIEVIRKEETNIYEEFKNNVPENMQEKVRYYGDKDIKELFTNKEHRQEGVQDTFSTTSPDRSSESKEDTPTTSTPEDTSSVEPSKKESALGAKMDSFVDNGIETSNEMALSIMPNDSIDDMFTAQKETFGQIADAIRRVMMETNLTGDTETIVKERPDAIKDTNLHPKKNVNNDVIFRDLGKQVRGELKSLQLAGNKADQREIITKVVQDNIGKINFTPNPNSPVEQVFGKGENKNPHPKKPTLSLREQQESSPFAQTRTTPVSFDEKKNNSNLGGWRSKKKLF